ncbi:MAG: DNA alkylation repair protein [Nanoarchaeota archaeon]
MNKIESDLEQYIDSERAKNLSRFFKTGKGEYGEGDVFIGVTVPQLRDVAKRNWSVPLRGMESLIVSPVHEHRLTALLILTYKWERSGEEEKKRIIGFYLKNIQHINNWDLVDLSAPNILGDWLLDKDRAILYRLARRKSLWERRIAVLSCFSFIRKRDFGDAFKIAEMLLDDKHDLIHKAVGWMLREIGKRDLKAEEAFLDKHAAHMPRTMLRYAIEKFDQGKRKRYLSKSI